MQFVPFPQTEQQRLGPFQVEVPAGDPMFRDIREAGLHEPWVHDALPGLIGPGSRVLDVGANIGAFALHAAALGAEVVAVEPELGNCELALRNARANGLFYSILPCALAPEDGTIFMSSGGSNTVVSTTGTPVPARSLDFILSSRFDLIKLDIEGYEYRVVSPSKRLWEQRPVVITEYSHHYQNSTSGVPGRTYLDLFLQHGYAFTILHPFAAPEACGHDLDLVEQRWQEKLNIGWTHLDLLLTPTGSP